MWHYAPPQERGAKMASINNKACTLKVVQIEKNPILALGTSERDVKTYERVAKAYGNVVPAIVGQSGSGYRILAGQARLEACAQQGIREIPAIVSELNGEVDQMKLALLLSTVREEGGALSEGAFIDTLLTRHGVGRRELMTLLKKSKSWISKRQTLALKLAEEVKGMVKDGTICARSAEEIAKLPPDVQFPFACVAARDGLNKTNVGELVGLYRRDDTGEAMRGTILNSPLTVLGIAGKTASRHKEKRSLPERIASAAGFLIRLTEELCGLMAISDTQSLGMASFELNRLRTTTVDLKAILDRWHAGVSPGKPHGGDSQ
jgi:ParB/RepB/Spo0J family partition protein